MGGPVSPTQLALAKAKLTPNIYFVYGLSGMGVVSLATHALLDAYPEYSSRCKPGVRVEAVDPAGKVLPPGELGELRVSNHQYATS